MIAKRSWKWGILVIAFLSSIISLIFLQQRYTTILQGGVEYQWPVRLYRVVSWIPEDFLMVDFGKTEAKWEDTEPPMLDQEIYVSVGVEKTGLLFIKGASAKEPISDEYITARAVHFANGVVEFKIPFNRVQLDLKKVNPAFYRNYEEPLIATLKLKQGKGVITGIYVKGVPLEAATPVVKDEKAEKTSREEQKGGNG